ncbi:MAG: hypothetical protein JWQ11_139 [Rhizobacter sp.]|nr:hypothetical protein [Rhizobacter sp.]
MLSHRCASRLFGSALLLSVTLVSQVHAMPVIGELQRLHASARPDESPRKLVEPASATNTSGAIEMRKTPATADVDSPGSGLLRLDQQTLILVVAGFAAALSLMARLR